MADFSGSVQHAPFEDMAADGVRTSNVLEFDCYGGIGHYRL